MQNDLISRSALIEHIKEFTNISNGYFENPHLLVRVIEQQPTVPPKCIATVSLDEEKLQEIVDKKIKEIEIDIQAIMNDTIDKFVAEAMKQFTDFELKHGYPTVADCKIILRDLAEQLKGGGEDATN